ncbi:hypothetical protein ACT691_04780 [Vibrio metschnikovii]
MANPSPPVGPALRSTGVSIMNSVKRSTQKQNQCEKGLPTPVVDQYCIQRPFFYVHH